MYRTPASGHLEGVHDAGRHLRRHQLVDLFREVVERLHAKRKAHALVRAVQVGDCGNIEAGGLLEQQCRTAAGRFASAIGHRRDLEIGAHHFRHAREQAPLVEVGDEVVEVWIHRDLCCFVISCLRGDFYSIGNL